MPQAQQQREIKLSEDQLMQMAKQEEAMFEQKQAALQKIGHMLSETLIAKEILKEAQKGEGKIMLNIGATILVEAKITNTEKCKRALSDNAYKEDSFEETLNWLTKKEEQIKKQFEKMQNETAQSQKKLSDYVGLIRQVEAEKKRMIQKAKQSPPTLSK